MGVGFHEKFINLLNELYNGLDFNNSKLIDYANCSSISLRESFLIECNGRYFGFALTRKKYILFVQEFLVKEGEEIKNITDLNYAKEDIYYYYVEKNNDRYIVTELYNRCFGEKEIVFTTKDGSIFRNDAISILFELEKWNLN